MKDAAKKPVSDRPRPAEEPTRSKPASDPPRAAGKDPGAEWTRCYYDAWNRRDWEWIGAMLTPDVEWAITGRDEQIRGMSAVIASFRSVVEGFPTAMIEVRAAHVAGPMIIAECSIKATRAGTALHTPTFCEIMELRGGRCVRGTTYADSVRMLLDMSQNAAAA